MKSPIRLALRPSAVQAQRLRQLQRRFAEACNHLAPLVRRSRCWNRVALHHMAYRLLRERFPDLGSQMACNAIYSVSRSARAVYQGRGSPFNLQRLGDRPLPLLVFLPEAPVYFDRHTLSIRDGQLSMFTLDGRLRFDLDLTPRQQERLRTGKLREIALLGGSGGFHLDFHLAAEGTEAAPRDAAGDELPDYLVVDETAQLREEAA